MARVGIQITGAKRLQRLLAEAAARAGDRRAVLDGVAGTVESQTRRRLSHDKEGPNGEAWPDWSPGYAETRHSNQHLLDSEGYLIDSIGYMVAGDRAEIGLHGDADAVGAAMMCAAIHQFGGSAGRGRKVSIPARPFLGIGDDDMREIETVLGEWLGKVIP